MKTETNRNDNLLDMEANRTLDTDTPEGLFGDGYLRRVYRTTRFVWAVVAAMLFVNSGLPAVIGLSLGTAITLGSLWILEVTVRLFIVPGTQMNVARAAILFNLKLPLLTLALGGAVWAATTGVANIFALVGGVILVQAVIVLKAVGAWLLLVAPAKQSPALVPAPQAKRYPAVRREAVPASDGSR